MHQPFTLDPGIEIDDHFPDFEDTTRYIQTGPYQDQESEIDASRSGVETDMVKRRHAIQESKQRADVPRLERGRASKGTQAFDDHDEIADPASDNEIPSYSLVGTDSATSQIGVGTLRDLGGLRDLRDLRGQGRVSELAGIAAPAGLAEYLCGSEYNDEDKSNLKFRGSRMSVKHVKRTRPYQPTTSLQASVPSPSSASSTSSDADVKLVRASQELKAASGRDWRWDVWGISTEFESRRKTFKIDLHSDFLAINSLYIISGFNDEGDIE